MRSNEIGPPARIDKEIHIDAPVERVWAVLTEPKQIGRWFGNGDPVEGDLSPGGRVVFDHSENGVFPSRIEKMEPHRVFAFWWPSGFPGEEPAEGNATLVEFTLTPEGTGTRLRVTESGFASIDVPPAPQRWLAQRNSFGWGFKIEEIRELTEQDAV